MLVYIARRIVYVIPIVLSVALVCFLLVHITPGDPLVAVLPADASQELAAQMRTAYGFDRPLPVQFGLWMWRALHGDLGNSIATGRPVLTEVLRAVSNTVTLAIAAALIGFTLGLLFGLIAGYFRDTWIDKVATSIAIAGVSVPHYWLGMVMVIIFSVQLNWLPAVGAGPGGSGAWGWDWEHMKYLVLPAITTSVIPMGIVTRTVRALTGDILSQDFVEALRAKGLRELDVFKHVIKNAAPTALAVMGLQLGYMLGGSILIETVFSWPGSGLLLNSAIFQRDLPLLQGTILVLALFFVTLNLLVDICASRDRSAHQAGLIMAVMSDTALQAAPVTKARGYWATVGRRIARDKVAMACAFVLALIFLSALFAPWLGLADPYQGSMIRRLRHIGTPNYPLGTDELGRDMLARLIYGGRLSLIIGILPVILAFIIGTSLGLVAGYVGGKLNTAIMRTIDVFYAFPSVLLAIAISGALGAGIVNSIVSLTIVFVPQITRVAESVTTGVRNMDFVEAARASGAGPLHHHARAHARQCAGTDLRLRHGIDLGVDDSRRRPFVPRPRHQAAGAGMGPDAEHAAHRDLRQPVGGGAAGRHDLCGVDLLQPAERRHAQRHGHQELTR